MIIALFKQVNTISFELFSLVNLNIFVSTIIAVQSHKNCVVTGGYGVENIYFYKRTEL